MSPNSDKCRPWMLGPLWAVKHMNESCFGANYNEVYENDNYRFLPTKGAPVERLSVLIHHVYYSTKIFLVKPK